MADFWSERAKFEKSGNFITRDWTKHTIVIDLQNAMGETYHFEFPPEADASSVPTRPAGDDVNINLYVPIATPKENNNAK